MPIIAESQQDGVFVWKFAGMITVEDFRGWTLETSRLALESTLPRLYHVMDVRTGQSDFGAILSQMRQVGTQPPGVFSAQREIHFLFVGSNQWAKLATNLSRQQQFGGFEMPIFHTMEDAEAFIRVDQQRPIDVKP
ncbi:MAG TPA: hypothetical protein VHD90_24960 [Phototrophicaceae bacterium]|nr:hypothetical protein [Phototrophicaceae bacterium]